MSKKLTFIGVALVLVGTILIVYAANEGLEAKTTAIFGYTSFAFGAILYFLNRNK